MKIHNLGKINSFIDKKKNHTAKKPVEIWVSKLRSANWEKPDDVLIDFPRGSSLGQNGFIFRVGGNKWRILVKIDYVRQIVLIKEIGTHADYDDWEFEK